MFSYQLKLLFSIINVSKPWFPFEEENAATQKCQVAYMNFKLPYLYHYVGKSLKLLRYL